MTVVVKVSGRPIEQPEACQALWGAIARASRNASAVVVHGGGSQVDQRLAQLGLETTRVQGLRVTPESHMGPIAGVLAGEVNASLVGVLRAAGADAVGATVAHGGLLETRRFAHPEFDLGCVGEVVGGSPRLAQALAGAGFVPVLASIGCDAEGALLNINADDAAAGVATVLGAHRLVLLTDVEGVLDATGTLVEELWHDKVEDLIASGVIEGGMAVKARAGVRAALQTGAEVVIGDWREADGLLHGAGRGTRFLASAPAGERAGIL